MTERIKEQIEAIRQSGETNMLDVNMVQWLANRENYFELVIYLVEHREDYIRYLLPEKLRENNTHYPIIIMAKQDLLELAI